MLLTCQWLWPSPPYCSVALVSTRRSPPAVLSMTCCTRQGDDDVGRRARISIGPAPLLMSTPVNRRSRRPLVLTIRNWDGLAALRSGSRSAAAATSGVAQVGTRAMRARDAANRRRRTDRRPVWRIGTSTRYMVGATPRPPAITAETAGPPARTGSPGWRPFALGGALEVLGAPDFAA